MTEGWAQHCSFLSSPGSQLWLLWMSSCFSSWCVLWLCIFPFSCLFFLLCFYKWSFTNIFFVFIYSVWFFFLIFYLLAKKLSLTDTCIWFIFSFNITKISMRKKTIYFGLCTYIKIDSRTFCYWIKSVFVERVSTVIIIGKV